MKEDELLVNNQASLVTKLRQLSASGMQEHYLRVIGEMGAQGEEQVLDVALLVLFQQLTNPSKHLAAIAFGQVREIVMKRNIKPSALFSMFPGTVSVLCVALFLVAVAFSLILLLLLLLLFWIFSFRSLNFWLVR